MLLFLQQMNMRSSRSFIRALNFFSLFIYILFFGLLLLHASGLLDYNLNVIFDSYFILLSAYCLAIVGFLFTENVIKGWFLFSLFYLLYLYPHFLSIFLSGDNPMIYNENHAIKSNNIEYNIDLIVKSLLLLFGVLVGYFFGNLKRYSLKTKVLWGAGVIKARRKPFVFLFLMVLFFAAFNLLNHSWTAISSGYTGGFSVLFGSLFMLNYLLVIWYVDILFKKKSKNLFVVMMVFLFLFIGMLGSRQMMLWLLLPLILVYLYRSLILERKVPILKMSIVALSFLVLAGVVMHFRVSKSFSSVSLDFNALIVASYLAYLYETSYTIYNAFSSHELSLSGIDFFPLRNLADIPIFLIPSFFLDNKSQYLTVIQFRSLYDISPYNNYFILGELILSLRYNLFFLLFGVVYGWISEVLYKKFIVKSYSQKYIAFYFVSVVYLYVFPVRGMLVTGVKLFIMFGVFMLILFSVRYSTVNHSNVQDI